MSIIRRPSETALPIFLSLPPSRFLVIGIEMLPPRRADGRGGATEVVAWHILHIARPPIESIPPKYRSCSIDRGEKELSEKLRDSENREKLEIHEIVSTSVSRAFHRAI